MRCRQFFGAERPQSALPSQPSGLAGCAQASWSVTAQLLGAAKRGVAARWSAAAVRPAVAPAAAVAPRARRRRSAAGAAAGAACLGRDSTRLVPCQHQAGSGPRPAPVRRSRSAGTCCRAHVPSGERPSPLSPLFGSLTCTHSLQNLPPCLPALPPLSSAQRRRCCKMHSTCLTWHRRRRCGARLEYGGLDSNWVPDLVGRAWGEAGWVEAEALLTVRLHEVGALGQQCTTGGPSLGGGGVG